MSEPLTIILTLGDSPAPRLDKALAGVVPENVTLSRSRLGKLIQAGAVQTMDGTVIDNLKYKAQAGQEFKVVMPKVEDYENAQPEDIPLDVVFEDEHLIVVNKPAGMVVHPAPGSETGTLVNALLHHFGGDLSGVGGEKRPGIVHRIDKDTSGLLVVAKTDEAHQGLANQFRDHSISRQYLAITKGVAQKSDPRLAGQRGVGFEDGGVIRIGTNIARHKTDRKRMAVVQDAGRHAITRARVLEDFDHSALMECWLETGRTHQIRVHFSHIGHGLIGDPIYGHRKQMPQTRFDDTGRAVIQAFNRQALHARSLGFVHPATGAKVEFTCDAPADFLKLLVVLRK
ncbi:pseudouridine synthase [Amylibacter marinus]|uniref:Pseudouridine synthase n=1 Tax=Amylibacter marinus TaxID=1475483 RepID=A0ABQ5VT97_9RHOB|nr:RluA family pseudouridine synthase [Amylibacter marinus]GLQ34662.1 pseudouridine synthase [Amylibacter marinus]